jgi:hypothetical protein
LILVMAAASDDDLGLGPIGVSRTNVNGEWRWCEGQNEAGMVRLLPNIRIPKSSIHHRFVKLLIGIWDLGNVPAVRSRWIDARGSCSLVIAGQIFRA